MKSFIFLLLLPLGANAIALPPLCTPPSNPDVDDIHIDCKIDTNMESPSEVTPSFEGDLTVLEYNIDRNGAGGDGSREAGMEPILNLLSDATVLPAFDVLLLSEVARGCDSWAGGANGAAVIAEHFEELTKEKHYFAYSVEYVEVGSASEGGECTIGNAIVSRFPLNDLEQVTYESQCCRYGGRWGGRSAVKAAVDLGSSQKELIVVSTHLESGQSDFKSVLNGTYVRERQASEITTTFPPSGDALTLIGGDFNSPLRSVDPTRLSFEYHKFHDSHDSMKWRERNTCPDGAIAQYAKALTLDFIYVSDDEKVKEVGICDDKDKCNGWSDHVPIFAKYSL